MDLNSGTAGTGTLFCGLPATRPGEVISLLMPQFVLTHEKERVERNAFSCKEQKTQLTTAGTIESLAGRSGREEGQGGLSQLQAVLQPPGSFRLPALPVSAQDNRSSSRPQAQTQHRPAAKEQNSSSVKSEENRSSKPFTRLAPASL